MSGEALPSIKNAKDGVIISHKEYITDIQASTLFNNVTYPINPGVVGTFPWLSQIAQNFEQYEFRGLMFHYRSLAGDGIYTTSNIALGAVIMATEYDVLSPPFPDKNHMENSQYANSSKPSVSFTHMVECERRQTPVSQLFVRSQSQLPGQVGDLRFSDLGNFQVAVQGMQGSPAVGTIGELWVTYEVQFFKPQLPDGLGGSIPYDHWMGTPDQNADSDPLFNQASPIPPPQLDKYSTLGTTYSHGGDHIAFITLPPNVPVGAIFLVMYSYSGTTAVACANVGAGSDAGATTKNVLAFGGDVHSSVTAPTTSVAASSASLVTSSFVQVLTNTPSKPATIVLVMSSANALPAGAQADLFIVQVPSAFG